MSIDATKIRNVAFIGLNRSGKTSLVESLLHLTGAISRRGKITDGTMTTDHEPEAISRQISTQVSMARTAYKDITFNVLDCPGFIDFQEEVKLALMGVDVAIFVVEPDPGRLIQMDALLRFTEEIGVARLVFVNKMDKPDLNFQETLQVLKDMPGTKTPRPLAPLHYPIGSGASLTGYVDVLKKEAFKYGAQGKPESSSVPSDIQSDLDTAREKLIESLADTDDTLLEMVLEGQDPPLDLLEKDLKQAVRAGTFVPILIGSAQTDAGVFSLLDAIISLCPSPAEREYKDKDGKPIEVKADGAVIAQVIRTYIHPQSGKLSLTRIFSGTVTADSQLIDISRGGSKERVGGLYWLLGKKQETMPSAGPGNIVAIARLETPRTGDTLVTEKETRVMPTPPPPPALYSLAIAPKNRNDEAKLSTLLGKLTEEDSILKVDRDPDTSEFCLYGQGEVHLTLSRQRLERKYNIQLDSKRPKIAYKETIQAKVEAHGRHKKQTGGRGQFGEVYLRIEPLERGAGIKFSESIVGGVVPRQFVPGVEKGVMEALQRGPLAQFPVVDVSVNLFDGSYHEVDSDEMSFRMAGILAMREGLGKAHPIILEPIAEVKIHVPSQYTSGVLGQITGLRGQILGYGPNPDRPGWDEISCNAPQGELWDYIIELRTLTQGLGYYVWKFSHLSPVPPQLSQELISQATAPAEA
ncbi:MAG TPA: elongation factor G [Candidatus Obscuribacterales bacterium]